MITVLCGRRNSIFKSLGADVYDEERNASTWAGGGQVIAMPPCQQWCRMRHNAKNSQAEKALGVWCTIQVQLWGGVLEQPRDSTLFNAVDLPRPGASDAHGFTIAVPQWWFGHRAFKATWLYICGVRPGALPAIPLRLGEPTHTVGKCHTGKKELSQAGCEATPPDFAIWLMAVAALAQGAKSPASQAGMQPSGAKPSCI
jgi:hypothetical protein